MCGGRLVFTCQGFDCGRGMHHITRNRNRLPDVVVDVHIAVGTGHCPRLAVIGQQEILLRNRALSQAAGEFHRVLVCRMWRRRGLRCGDIVLYLAMSLKTGLLALHPGDFAELALDS